METINITKANALKAYNSGTKDQRDLLENMLGKETFKKAGKITDRVKTFADACVELGLNSNHFEVSVSFLLGRDFLSISAYAKLVIIARALNEGWEPNWDDSSEIKYYPWMKWQGSGFSDCNYGYSGTLTSVGSRLCFKSEELARYAAKQFNKEYNAFFKL